MNNELNIAVLNTDGEFRFFDGSHSAILAIEETIYNDAPGHPEHESDPYYGIDDIQTISNARFEQLFEYNDFEFYTWQTQNFNLQPFNDDQYDELKNVIAEITTFQYQ